MPRGEKRTPSAVICSDLHLRADTPVCRTDDYLEAQLRKLRDLRRLAGFSPILIAGDVGHKAQWPNWLLRVFIDTMTHRNVFIIPGQHDLPGHSIQMLPKSGLGVLATCPNTYVLDAGMNKFEFDDFELYAFPYGADIKNSLSSSKKRLVCMAHMMVVHDKPLWPGQEAPKSVQILKKHPDYDLIITGDNHNTFTTRYKDRWHVNPGSMMRMTSDKADHVPCAFLWYADDNSIEKVELPHEKDVVTRVHIETVEQRDERIEAFVSRMNEDVEIGLSFEDNLKKFLKANQVRRPVQELVWEAVEQNTQGG